MTTGPKNWGVGRHKGRRNIIKTYPINQKASPVSLNQFIVVLSSSIASFSHPSFSIHTHLGLQGLHSWFGNEFLPSNKKLAALRATQGDSPAFDDKQSVVRRLLSSVCHDYGSMLTARFARQMTANDNCKRTLRKYANNLIWNYLENLHAYGARKVPHGHQLLSLKAVCTALISRAITNRLSTLDA